MTAVPGASSANTAAARERVLTLPLVVFFAAVLTVMGFALRAAAVRPSAAQAIEQLADGDPDGDERERLLRILVEDGRKGGTTAERWAGALAAVSLEDHDGLAALLAVLGGGAVPRPLPVDPRGFLHLGDPMLRNLLAAWQAEAGGDQAAAHRHWRQVAVQCRFAPRPLAAELAAAGTERTR
jgi:hypothetical protein